MPGQLDILALEPFYGGARRAMLESLIRCSRHRWTLLKLPPRRIERRLQTASIWFAEQLSRHLAGRVDVLFVSDALNLSDLLRLVPELSHKPTVAYFHSNQLPAQGESAKDAWDLVNLSTATAATEVWFNSLFHLRWFLAKASSLVQKHSELAARNPLPEIAGKAHVMLPPVDLGMVHDFARTRVKRDEKTVFVDTRDTDMKLLNAGLLTLARRATRFKLVTVGPVKELASELTRTALAETNDAAHVEAMLGSGVYLSAKTLATHDHHAVRAVAAGCWPIVPAGGVYPELIPESLHAACLYEQSSDALATRAQNVWHLTRPEDADAPLKEMLHRFDTLNTCRHIDQRLEELAVIHTVR